MPVQLLFRPHHPAHPRGSASTHSGGPAEPDSAYSPSAAAPATVDRLREDQLHAKHRAAPAPPTHFCVTRQPAPEQRQAVPRRRSAQLAAPPARVGKSCVDASLTNALLLALTHRGRDPWASAPQRPRHLWRCQRNATATESGAHRARHPASALHSAQCAQSKRHAAMQGPACRSVAAADSVRLGSALVPVRRPRKPAEPQATLAAGGASTLLARAIRCGC